ncbi:MAG: hypothetical protein WBG94_02065, partial [Anaerolineales bacterium]
VAPIQDHPLSHGVDGQAIHPDARQFAHDQDGAWIFRGKDGRVEFNPVPCRGAGERLAQRARTAVGRGIHQPGRISTPGSELETSGNGVGSTQPGSGNAR